MGGSKNVMKNDPPSFFGSKIMNLLVFFDFEPKKCFSGPDSIWFFFSAEWDERLCIHTHFSRFCYVGVFGDLSDPVVPPLGGASGDVGPWGGGGGGDWGYPELGPKTPAMG